MMEFGIHIHVKQDPEGVEIVYYLDYNTFRPSVIELVGTLEQVKRMVQDEYAESMRTVIEEELDEEDDDDEEAEGTTYA